MLSCAIDAAHAVIGSGKIIPRAIGAARYHRVGGTGDAAGHCHEWSRPP
ncbi:hypothetical protein [Massilia varians]|nr:hypothetical protein [Massilia varians]